MNMKPPPRLGAELILLLSLASACGSEDPQAQPQGSASPPAGSAAEMPPAPVSVGPSRAPAASDRDSAATNAAAGGAASGAPKELPDSSANRAPAAIPEPGSCNPETAGDSFEKGCAACAGSDACALCLCSTCTDEVQRCVQTAGCSEILACGRASGCSGRACYCGSADAVSCLNGNADGVCRGVIESAPGGRAPTISDPSAGPATDRAGAVAQCMQRDEACRSACGAS